MNDATTRIRPAIVGLEALTTGQDAAAALKSNGTNGPAPHGSIRPWKVAAVIPCFNRRDDLQLILKDVARQDLRPVDGRPIQLWCVVVDNASTQPLSTINVPAGVMVEFVRLERNSGGSGGFNAGMAQGVRGGGPGGGGLGSALATFPPGKVGKRARKTAKAPGISVPAVWSTRGST